MKREQRSKREREYVQHVQMLRNRTRKPTNKYSRKVKHKGAQNA